MRVLKIFIILSVSFLVLLVPKKIATACGFFVYPGEYRFWLLQPDLTNQKDLTPFFFASIYLYKGDINAAVESYPDKNIAEWHNELKKSVPKSHIDSLLNYTKPQFFFEHEREIASYNKFLNFLYKPENKELYQYLQLSKKVEQIAADPDPWGENKFPQPNLEVIIKEADALHKRTSSAFIKLRSAYQLIRLYEYNGQNNKLHQIYDTRIEPVKTQSWIKTAALYKKAINTGGYESDYLLSKVFDKGGYNRSRCLVRIKSSDVDSILMYAKNRHEKTVIRAMQVFNYPGRSLSLIREIYNAEPDYNDLPFLLLREINKIEDWLVTTKLTKFESPATGPGNWWLNGQSDSEYESNPALNYKRDKEYAKQLYNFLLQLIAEKKQKNISLLQLYTAHLALINNDPAASEQLLSQIKDESQLPPNVKTQLRINRFLLLLEKGFSKQVEDEFMGIVKQSSQKLGIYDAEIMKDQLILYTARKLINKGEKAKGLMLIGQTKRALGELPIDTYRGVYQEMEETATPVVYDQMISILEKKNKTSFEKFITNNTIKDPWSYYSDESEYRLDKNKILDCKASWYIRNYSLEKALNVLQQIPDSFWKKEPYSYYIGGNPFYLNVNDAHRVTKNDKLDLNKKEVVEQMIRLEAMAKASPEKAGMCYFQLANAWYNMTWFGKNWLMVKQWWSINENGHIYPYLNRSFNEDYYGCKKAREYYLLALKTTKDKELALLCCFIAGKCENNFQRYQFYLKNPSADRTDYSFSGNPYINRLKQKGVTEDKYDNLVKECALYIDYINKYNKVL